MNKGIAGYAVTVLGAAALIAVGGCQTSGENALADFIVEFARSALAAYLL